MEYPHVLSEREKTKNILIGEEAKGIKGAAGSNPVFY